MISLQGRTLGKWLLPTRRPGWAHGKRDSLWNLSSDPPSTNRGLWSLDGAPQLLWSDALKTKHKRLWLIVAPPQAPSLLT